MWDINREKEIQSFLILVMIVTPLTLSMEQ